MSRILLLMLFFTASLFGKSYAEREEGKAFIAEFLPTSTYTKAELYQIFLNVYPKQSILKLIARPAEKTKPWYQYRRIFLDDARLRNGVRFYHQHQAVLEQAYQQYGVDPFIIVAIIGVETRYGKVMGKDRVIDALATLGLSYPKRAPFFRKELATYLRMAKRYGFDVFSKKGSYAGAMGMAQFMPSSYLNYAVDYENDGVIDLWHNPNDAIFSVANYLSEHGWQVDRPIITEADMFAEIAFSFERHAHKPFTTLHQLREQGVFPLVESSRFVDDDAVGLLTLASDAETDKVWITFNNFSVITKYNTSPLYAKSVQELALNLRHTVE